MREPKSVLVLAVVAAVSPAMLDLERQEVRPPSMGPIAIQRGMPRLDDSHGTQERSKINEPVQAGAGSAGALPVGKAYQPDAFQSNAFQVGVSPLGSPIALLSSVASSANC